MTDTQAAESSAAPKLDTKDKTYAWLNSYSSSSRDRLNNSIPSPVAKIEQSTPDGWWLRRELARGLYEFGQVYCPLPADILQILATYGASPNVFHFVHVSMGDESKIAFTESWEAGVADRQQQISLGKYIKKYHPQVPEFAIKQAQEALTARLKVVEVQFTRNFREMLEIYSAVAPACMSKGMGSGEYKMPSNLHPLMAYEYDGFQLAYYNDARGRPAARAMTWIDPANAVDKRYTRPYGDILLTAQLNRLGYRRTHFGGAKLKRIDTRHGSGRFIVCPYIDDHGMGVQGTGTHQSVRVYNDYLEIVSNGSEDSKPTSPHGVVNAPKFVPHALAKSVNGDVSYSNPVTVTEHKEFDSVIDPATGHLHVLVGNNSGSLEWWNFQAADILEEHTTRLFPHGRVLTNELAFDRWQVISATPAVLGMSDNGYPDDLYIGSLAVVRSNVVTRAARFSGLRQLSGNHYSTPRVVSPGPDRYIEFGGSYGTVEETTSSGWLSMHATTLTGGRRKGETVHNREYNTWTDPVSGLVYLADEAVRAFDDTMIPLEFAVGSSSLGICFDSRTTKLNRFNVPAGANKQYALTLDDEVITPFDDVLINDRDEDMSRSVGGYYSLLDSGHNVLSQLLIVDNNRLCFSKRVTPDDRAATSKWLLASTPKDLMRALQSTIPGYKQTSLVSAEWAQFYKLMLSHNPVPVELNPQPETVAVSAPSPAAVPSTETTTEQEVA
jgi:hypothetical protein